FSGTRQGCRENGEGPVVPIASRATRGHTPCDDRATLVACRRDQRPWPIVHTGTPRFVRSLTLTAAAPSAKRSNHFSRGFYQRRGGCHRSRRISDPAKLCNGSLRRQCRDVCERGTSVELCPDQGLG